MIEAIERIHPRIETFGPQEFGRWVPLDDEFNITQPLAKLAWQAVKHLRHHFSDLIVIHF